MLRCLVTKREAVCSAVVARFAGSPWGGPGGSVSGSGPLFGTASGGRVAASAADIERGSGALSVGAGGAVASGAAGGGKVSTETAGAAREAPDDTWPEVTASR